MHESVSHYVFDATILTNMFSIKLDLGLDNLHGCVNLELKATFRVLGR